LIHFGGCLLYLFASCACETVLARRDNVNVIDHTPDAHEFGTKVGRLSPSKHASVPDVESSKAHDLSC